MHLHPFSSDEAGRNATVGRFLRYAQSAVTGNSIRLWHQWTPDVDLHDGDRCPDGSPGHVAWAVGRWNKPWPTTTGRAGNPAGYTPRDGDIVALYFVPAGDAPPPEPPGARKLLTQISNLKPGESFPPPSGPPPSG
jgi:putative cofactor-binding repeat protein